MKLLAFVNKLFAKISLVSNQVLFIFGSHRDYVQKEQFNRHTVAIERNTVSIQAIDVGTKTLSSMRLPSIESRGKERKHTRTNRGRNARTNSRLLKAIAKFSPRRKAPLEPECGRACSTKANPTVNK